MEHRVRPARSLRRYDVLRLAVHLVRKLFLVRRVKLHADKVELEPEGALVAAARPHREAHVCDAVQRYRALLVLDPALGREEKLGERYLGHLPVGAAPRVQHVMVDVVPQDVVVALRGQVDQVGAAIAPHLQHERIVLTPVVEGVPLERFLRVGKAESGKKQHLATATGWRIWHGKRSTYPYAQAFDVGVAGPLDAAVLRYARLERAVKQPEPGRTALECGLGVALAVVPVRRHHPPVEVGLALEPEHHVDLARPEHDQRIAFQLLLPLLLKQRKLGPQLLQPVHDQILRRGALLRLVAALPVALPEQPARQHGRPDQVRLELAHQQPVPVFLMKLNYGYENVMLVTSPCFASIILTSFLKCILRFRLLSILCFYSLLRFA